MIKRAIVAALLAVAPALAEDPLQDPETALMGEMFAYLAAYRALEPEDRSLFRLDYCVTSDRADPGAISLSYSTGDVRHVLAVDQAGCVIEPPPAEHFARNPLIVSDQPRGSMAVDVHVRPVEPLGSTMDPRSILSAAAQASRALRRESGSLSLALPPVDGAVFVWDGAAPELAHAVLDDGARVALDVDYDRAWLRPDRDGRLRRAVSLEFGAPPIAVSLVP